MGNSDESLSAIVISNPYAIYLIADLLSGGANANVRTSAVGVAIVMGGWKPNLTMSGTAPLGKVVAASI